MKKLYSLCVLLALALTASAQDDLTWWGYYNTQSTSLTGNYKLGTYEAAMFVAGDGTLAGASIEAFRAQTRLYSNAKNFKFWVRATLDGENLAEATPETLASSSASMTTATLAEPYAVPAEGLYVGYTFELANWYSDYDYTPVVYANGPTAQSFYLKQPGETDFTDKSSTGCLAMQVGFKAPAVTMWWGNYTGSESTGLLGNNKVPGDYAAAMFVAGDGSLKDADITAIRIQTRLSASSSENVTFWLRSQLDGENLVELTPDAVASSGFTTVTLAEPYKIPETGLYVGYSFRVTQWWNEYEGSPVVYAKKSVPQGLYLMQPGESEFTDKSSTGCLAAQIEVSSSSLTMDAVQVADDIDDMVALVGQPIALSLNLTNQGAAGVQSIDFTYTLDGAEKQAHLDLTTPIDAMIGAKATVSVELEAPQQAGQQEIEIQITKVNGNDNGVTGRKSKCSVIVTVLAESAKRTAVAEIFYNATNGYAARALVGQQQLSQQLGKDVIAFLVDHYSGKLNVAEYGEFQKYYSGESFTNKYTTYPVAEVNRAFTTDPYTGSAAPSNYGENHFAADAAVSPTLSKPTEASVSLTAEWTDDTKTKAALQADATFLADFKSAPYRLAFVVIMDGMKETISNYICYYKTAYADDDMQEWRDNPYTNTDYKLNSVAVASSDVNGIQKSLPSTIVAGESNVYDYEMEMPDLDGQDEATNARAVVLLINKDTKEIVNAAIAPILTHEEATGIEHVGRQAAEASVCYDLQGRQVAAPAKGLYIVNGKKVIK